jgi:hypothetical protein
LTCPVTGPDKTMKKTRNNLPAEFMGYLYK